MAETRQHKVLVATILPRMYGSVSIVCMFVNFKSHLLLLSNTQSCLL